MRDADTKVAKKSVGEGFKIKMDDIGNILIKRYGKSNVFVHNTSMANEETVIGADILQMPNMALAPGTSAKLFDMRKYTTNINREFSRSYPESRRLERQCLSAISLVKSNNNLINNPLWILVINIVAIDMLKNRLQALPKSLDAMGMRVPTAGSEDPYSTIESQVGLIYPTPAASDDSNNSNNSNHSNHSSHSSKGRRRSVFNAGFIDESPYVPKPDYEVYNQSVPMLTPTQKSSSKSEQRKKQDDPYYCGLLARIPNFIKSSKKSPKQKEPKISRKISASQQQIVEPQPAQPLPIATFHQYPAHQPPYYPYKLLHARHHRLSQSQLSLWDARSLISAHE
ncbi:uncharacterized protein LOC118754537 [Rhagoletis pomonella]|nr:uncharacterized protein LOC118743692 [Rhagoletis pomonella]XP_036345303.1 uncharacterized protein LOC118754537 [Rhagoletis pomonella]